MGWNDHLDEEEVLYAECAKLEPHQKRNKMQYILNQTEYEENMMLKEDSTPAIPSINEVGAIKDFIYNAIIEQSRDTFMSSDNRTAFRIDHNKIPDIFKEIIKERFSR